MFEVRMVGGIAYYKITIFVTLNGSFFDGKSSNSDILHFSIENLRKLKILLRTSCVRTLVTDHC
uniref:Uncharacterized protein n=1 Tax=Romanomermis culicivorax TaxID=13658 RepID=A0A915I9I2_ROMCU